MLSPKAIGAGFLLAIFAGPCAADGPALGRLADPQLIAGMDLTILPDGQGLPPGKGSVRQGLAIYQAKCLACHGVEGKGGLVDQLAGGLGTLATPTPVKTVGSFWPYATTVFDYVRRAMPLTAPQSLTSDEVYALTAYLLSLDGIVKPDAVLDAKSLPRVKMPNRNGFRQSLQQ